MTHVRKVSRALPVGKAELVECPHTLEYILDNLPSSVYDIVKLVIVHVKNWPEE